MTIKTKRFWSMSSVREACIANDLYTYGDCEEYEAMLNKVKELAPTFENIYTVAKDIAAHSECQTVENVMYILENKAVTTTFEVNENA